MVKKEKPDLILLDIKMPVMDGVTMMNLLGKEDAKKVIILTNYEPDKKIINTVMKNTPLHYFIKSDVQFGDLMQKVDEALADVQ